MGYSRSNSKLGEWRICKCHSLAEINNSDYYEQLIVIVSDTSHYIHYYFKYDLQVVVSHNVQKLQKIYDFPQ